MQDPIGRIIRSKLGYRLFSRSLPGYPLLLCWRREWIAAPRGDGTASLRDGRILTCRLTDRTQRTMYLGLFEPAETRLVKELLVAGDLFIDIGAHIGWYTTIASSLVQEGKVIAFEPYPENASSLKENLRLNHCLNVQVVETALGEESGTTTIASSGGDSGSVTALPWAQEGRSEVPITTLDDVDLNTGIGPAALVKMDVEGWEGHVIRGATKTLSRAKRVLLEINRPALAEAGSSQEEIFDLLRRCGFSSFFHVTEGGFRRFSSDAVSNVLATRALDPIASVSGTGQGLSRRTMRHLQKD